MIVKIRKIIEESIYLNDAGGFSGYDDATNKIAKLIEDNKNSKGIKHATQIIED